MLTTPAMPLSPTLARFQRRAQRLVALYGWRGAQAQDLVAAMVLEVLEHPTKTLQAAYCYQHALDRLLPRRQGTRITWEPWRERYRPVHQVWPEPFLQDLFRHVAAQYPQGTRALRMALLRHGYGWTQRQVAAAAGCTESRVSQLLAELASRVRLHLRRQEMR